MILEIEFSRRHVDRHHRTRRHGTRRLAVFTVRHHAQTFAIDRRQQLAEGHLHLVAFERLHHAGRLLPFEHHLRTDLDFARRRDDGLCVARRNGLAAALLAAFAAAPQLLHFAFDAGRLLRVDGIRLLDPLLEGVEIAPDEPRHFTLGLRLADLLDRLLDATVGLSH